MTLVPRFCIRLALALGFMALVGLSAFNQSASAQTVSKHKPQIEAYTIVATPDGSSLCRDATPQEKERIVRRATENGKNLRLINHLENRDYVTGGVSADVNDPTLPGLKIFLLATPRLDANPTAKAAFIKAAKNWEDIIKTPITVYIKVDVGPDFFEDPTDPYDPQTIGSTSSVAASRNFSDVRARLINTASNPNETALYGLLPNAGSLPTDSGSLTSILVSASIARALGILPANASSTDTASMPHIGFNSAFNFDYDQSNGISGGLVDFTAVATHEIGHALGFSSQAGSTSATPRPAVLDLFRFRPGVTDFTSAPRVMTIGGGSQIFFAGTANIFTNGSSEAGLSTGGPNGSTTNGGDGRQSSHWRDDTAALGGFHYGIMDPTIASGRLEVITQNDLQAFNYMGYNLENSALPPQAPAPANDNFANAQVISGCSGSVTGTNDGATREAGEGVHYPQSEGGVSVWYQWQAPSTGSVTITTLGSDSGLDTTLGIYTGNSVSGLQMIIEGDDVNTQQGLLYSSVTFNAVAGTLYRIAVDGYLSSDTGNIKLNWTAQNCNVTPPTCTYSISPSSLNFNSGGGSGSTVSVTAGAGCAWTAVSNNSFITITGGASGTGNGTVTYSVAPNPSVQRTGTMTIAGQTFTVTQEAGASCSYSISPTSLNFAAGGGFGATVTVTTGITCAWTAVSNNPSFITITNGASGTGTASVTYAVAPNSGAARTGTMTIAGQTFTVTQNSATPSVSTVQLAQSTYNVTESAGSVSILVNRSGDLSSAVSVSYMTTDASDFLQNCNVVNGKATSRCDYISLVGTLHFASGENSKTLSLPIVDDTYPEGAESFFISLSSPLGGAVIGANQTATVTLTDNGNDGIGLGNPIDATNFFVRQHYMDFLGREPDPASIGWNNQINNCVPSQPSCDRLSVSQGIYNSPEFKDRGYFIYKFYATALGRKPGYDEFVLDRARVSGFQTEAELEQSKLDFIAHFMDRVEFRAIYDAQGTNRSFVETILLRAQLTYANKENLIQSMDGGFITRAGALRAIAESGEANSRFLTESTIVMHYFGYLRRDPDGAYQDWINIFNQTGDSRNVTNGFVNSQEYRNRFSQ